MYSFKKEERLCSSKLIDLLFKSGSSFFLYPFRVHFLLIEDSKMLSSAQVLFIAPKRNFKRAVDRNFLKRRMRESYRKRKEEELYRNLPPNHQLLLGIQYMSKEKEGFAVIDKKLSKVLHTVLTKLHENR